MEETKTTAASPSDQVLAPVRARELPDRDKDGRRRKSSKRRDGYRKRPWLLREVYGAPVWAMLLLAAVVVAVAVLYLVTR